MSYTFSTRLSLILNLCTLGHELDNHPSYNLSIAFLVLKCSLLRQVKYVQVLFEDFQKHKCHRNGLEIDRQGRTSVCEHEMLSCCLISYERMVYVQFLMFLFYLLFLCLSLFSMIVLSINSVLHIRYIGHSLLSITISFIYCCKLFMIVTVLVKWLLFHSLIISPPRSTRALITPINVVVIKRNFKIRMMMFLSVTHYVRQLRSIQFLGLIFLLKVIIIT